MHSTFLNLLDDLVVKVKMEEEDDRDFAEMERLEEGDDAVVEVDVEVGGEPSGLVASAKRTELREEDDEEEDGAAEEEKMAHQDARQKSKNASERQLHW